MAKRWIEIVVEAIVAVLVGCRVSVDVRTHEHRTSVMLWVYERNMAVKEIEQAVFDVASLYGFDVCDCSVPFTSKRTDDGKFYSITVINMSHERDREYAHVLVPVIK